MSISKSGFAALLVVATFALTSCGGDDGAATATTSPAPASGTVQTTTTTTQASAPSTTTQKQAPATTPPATTTQKAQTTKTTAKTQTSQTTAAAPSTTSAGSGGCGPVEIGVREGDIDLTYARIKGQRNVSCATVTIVAQQWGRQQLGIERALLPKGWSCTSGNSCSGSKGGFSFVLYKPQ